ncbi:MAG TPA: hypothetical protein VKC61_02075 [Pyrinomonadaceae bacterium]|nr:hypothetical protein [Pyrinomonadaceae bacterium]
MTTNTTNGVVLKRVELTASLYEPTSPGPGEQMRFLATTNATGTIPLEDTWAEAGSPIVPGYFLFLNAPPADARVFEDEMKKLLPPAPTTSAIAWATSGASPSVQTLLKTKLNNSKPCVDGNTELSLPPGLEGAGFTDNSPVLSITTDGFITGFVITHPALTSPQSNPLGLILPMTGSFVGCVQFQGLTSQFAGPPIDESALKNLANVSIDPHNPLDTQRNYMRFTGAEYVLTKRADSYFITPAS